jgi:hypothetical protein
MKKTASQESPATEPLAGKKKPEAGRTAQKACEAASAKARQTKARWEGLPEDPPPVAGEYPPILLPIRSMTPAQWKVPLDMKTPLFDWPPFRELIEAIFKAGWYDNKAGWREAMILLARQDERCKQVLGQWLSECAVQLKREELDLFARAVERISNAPERANQKRVYALLFVLRCVEKTGFLPPQNKVRQFLKKIGFAVDETKAGILTDPRKNEARDLFKGPVLGKLPKGKAGAPRGPRG